MFETRMERHWGRPMRCYADRPATVDIMFRQAVERTPDADALIDGSLRLSYRQLRERVDRVAAGLAARGVRADDRVAVMMENRVEVVITVLALARLGAILLPVDIRLRQPEIANIFADATPVAVVHAARFAAELPPDGPVPDMRFAVETGGFDALLSCRDAAPGPAERDEEAAFAIIYTSGTTGRPKGAVLTNLGVVHTCLHWIDRLRLQPGDRCAVAAPWSHVAGLCGGILPMLPISGLQVLMRQFNRRVFLQLVAEHRLTVNLLMPAMFDIVLLDPELSRFDLSSWRIGIIGGAPTTEATIRRCAQALPGVDMCRGYGATETTCPVTAMAPGECFDHLDSIGPALPCAEIRVMDEDGNEVAPGENGEFWIGGPIVVPGYWRADAANEAAFQDGFWKSGDIGSVDAQGYARIIDRKKDMIDRGGFKVYPAEVENVLCEVPGVIEAAVVGRPDMLGESVIAFVTARRPVSTEQQDAISEIALRTFCAARVADFKVPMRVVVGYEALPRNPTGKVQKDRLRARALELRSR